MQKCPSQVRMARISLVLMSVSLSACFGRSPLLNEGVVRAGVQDGPSSAAGSWHVRSLFNALVKALSSALQEETQVAVGEDGRRRITYHGYQVLRVMTPNKEDALHIADLRAQGDPEMQFWADVPMNSSTDVLVSPQNVDCVKNFFDEYDLKYSVLAADVQKTIAHQNPRMSREQRDALKEMNGHPYTWKRYHRYADMLDYMNHLAFRYPHLVRVVTVGSSSEGLPIKVIKISTHETLPDPADITRQSGGKFKRRRQPKLRGSNEENAEHNGTISHFRQPRGRRMKPIIWIDGGSHAREWISPAVAMYLVHQLVEKFERHRRLVLAADWYILPVMNPDGYEYSFTTDRLWRKTRSNHEVGRMFYRQPCVGVDLNRNWGFHWGEVGASDDPCAETYAGPRAFSEPESRAASDFIARHKDRIQIYLTLHSYSQMWLLPFAYTKKRSPDYEDLMSKAQVAVDALRRVYGTNYEVGTPSVLLYPASGTSDDWAKGAAGIKYSYSIELRDRGRFGFLLPASDIVPTAKEIFVAIKALANAVVCR